MDFEAFVFDMDGTMLDNMNVHMQVWYEYLSDLGIDLQDGQFYKTAAGRTNGEILRKLVRADMSEAEVEQHSQKKEELYRQRYQPMLKPVHGLPEFLEQARQLGIPMAVASSAGCENIQFHLDGLRAEDYFKVVVGAEDVSRGKPDPEIFLTAASRLGVDPARCLVFEDSPTGLEAATRAGMRALALTTTYPAERLAQSPAVLRIVPDYTSLNPGALLHWEI